MPPARLSDIALSLGLNIATVSRALRDDPRVRYETKQKIQEEARRLGYRPHWGARALAEGRSRTIWMLTPGLDSPVERDPALGAGRWFFDHGYDLLLAQHHGDPVVYTRLLERLAHGGADGAVIIPGARTGDHGDPDRLLLDRGVPFVYLDRAVPGVSVPVVTTDNYQAAFDLVVRLSQGRADPARWVAQGFSPELNSVEADRARGALDAARSLGLPVSTGALAGPGIVVATSPAGLPPVDQPSVVSAGVFDAWAGPAPRFSRALVVHQDFRTLGEAAARTLLALVDGEFPPGVTVPARGILEWD